MRLRKSLILSATLLMGMSLSSQAALIGNANFAINLNFSGDLTASQQTVFQDAKNFWESKIDSYASAVSFQPVVTINAQSLAIDGVSGILGQAGPTTAFNNGFYNYVADGNMTFDSADMNAMETNGTLLSVITHEMGHVLGFGTLWELNGLYDKVNNPGHYTGANAVSWYQTEFGATTNYVDVDTVSGDGTAHGHWDESWLGGSSDLMTGFLEGATTFSNTTLAVFEDLGYNVNYNVQQPATQPTNPVPVGFVFSGLALLGLYRKVK